MRDWAGRSSGWRPDAQIARMAALRTEAGRGIDSRAGIETDTEVKPDTADIEVGIAAAVAFRATAPDKTDRTGIDIPDTAAASTAADIAATDIGQAAGIAGIETANTVDTGIAGYQLGTDRADTFAAELIASEPIAAAGTSGSEDCMAGLDIETGTSWIPEVGHNPAGIDTAARTNAPANIAESETLIVTREAENKAGTGTAPTKVAIAAGSVISRSDKPIAVHIETRTRLDLTGLLGLLGLADLADLNDLADLADLTGLAHLIGLADLAGSLDLADSMSLMYLAGSLDLTGLVDLAD